MQFPSHSSLQSETVAYANSFLPSPLKSPYIFTSEVCENKKLTIRKNEIEAIFFIIICVLCISKIKILTKSNIKFVKIIILEILNALK